MVRRLPVGLVLALLLAATPRSAKAEPFVSTFEIALPNPLAPLSLDASPPPFHDLVISYSFSQDDLVDAVVTVDLPPNLILIDAGDTAPFSPFCNTQNNPSVDSGYDWICTLTAAQVDVGTGGSGTMILRVAPAHFAFSDGDPLTVSATLTAANLTVPQTATFTTFVDTTPVSPKYQSSTLLLNLGTVERPADGAIGLSSLLLSSAWNRSDDAIGRGVEYRLEVSPGQSADYVTDINTAGGWQTLNPSWTPLGTLVSRLSSLFGPATVQAFPNGAKGLRGTQIQIGQIEPVIWTPCADELLPAEVAPSVWAPETPSSSTLVELVGNTSPVARTLSQGYNFNCASDLAGTAFDVFEAVAGSPLRVNMGFQLPMGAVPLHDMFIALQVEPSLSYRTFQDSPSSIYLKGPSTIDLESYACVFGPGDVDLARFLSEQTTACTPLGPGEVSPIGTTHLIAYSDEYFIDQPYGRIVQRFLSLYAETNIPCGATGQLTHAVRLQTRRAPGGVLSDSGWTTQTRTIVDDARFRGNGPLFVDGVNESSIISADRGSIIKGLIYLTGSLGKNPTGEIVLPPGVEFIDLELRPNEQSCERPNVILQQSTDPDGSTRVNVSLREQGTTDGDWYFVESCAQTDCFPAGHGTVIVTMYVDHTHPWTNGEMAQFTTSWDSENNTYDAGDPLESSNEILINVPNQQRLLIEPTCSGTGTVGDCTSSEPDGRTPGLEVTIENRGGELLTALEAIIEIPQLGDSAGSEANTLLASIENLDGLSIECFDGSAWSATCGASATRVKAVLASAGPGVSKTFTVFLTVDPLAPTGTKIFGTGSLTSNELPEVPAAAITPIRVNLCPGALEAGVYFDEDQDGVRDPGERFLANWFFDLTDERPQTTSIEVDEGGRLSIALSRGSYTWDVRRDGDPTVGTFRIVGSPPQTLAVCPDVVTTLEVPVICDCADDGDPCTDDVCDSFGNCTYTPRTEPLPGVLDDTCDYVDDDCDGAFSEDWVAPLVTECPNEGGCVGTGGVTECIDNQLYVYGCEYNPMPEICDGIDNNCDWVVDNGTFPAEICDGIDNNCDGLTDNGIVATELCDNIDNDCDGLTDAADPDYQGAPERCDGVDNDCDGRVDIADPDMVLEPCVDPWTNNTPVGVCAGAVPTADLCVSVQFGNQLFTYWAGCGEREFLLSAYQFHFTPSGMPGTYINQFYNGDTCDGLDNDCDGSIDEDFASSAVSCLCGTVGTTTCEAGVLGSSCPEVEVSAEICDGLDNDCDGLVDQADPDLVVPACESELGVCDGVAKPRNLCAGGSGWLACGPADYAFAAFPEYRSDDDCDGVDNDCDGLVDEHFASYPVECVDGCSPIGTVACNEGELVDTCELGSGSPELCDGIDNDCDGLPDLSDPDLEAPLCANQQGVCFGARAPLDRCESSGWAACEVADYAAHGFPAYAVNDAVCDGLDNDCDGLVDEEFVGELKLCPPGSCQPVARDRCVGGALATGCEPSGPGCPTGPGAECEACSPATALYIYGIAEDQDGVPQGSFRCTRSPEGVICDVDENGALEVSNTLWCGP